MDNLFVLIKVFAFALFVLIMFIIWGELTTDKLNEQLWDKTSVGTKVRNNTTVAIDNMDWIFMIVYFGLHIGIIVLAYMLRSHPIVYVAGIFIIVILVLIAVPLSNVWEELLVDSAFVSSVASVPKTSFIMGLLPIFEMIWAFLTLIAFAAFARGDVG